MGRAEAYLAAYIRAQCPEFAARINNLRDIERVSISTCKHCGEAIMWSNENSYKIPLSPKDGLQHLCLLKNKESVWGDGECPYCGDVDCNCGE